MLPRIYRSFDPFDFANGNKAAGNFYNQLFRAMNLPEKVSIGGMDFRVIEWAMRDLCGELHFDRREIWISNEIGYDEKWETLRHEMLHAALSISGQSFAEKYDEEPIVRAIENIFFPAWDKLKEEPK